MIFRMNRFHYITWIVNYRMEFETFAFFCRNQNELRIPQNVSKMLKRQTLM